METIQKRRQDPFSVLVVAGLVHGVINFAAAVVVLIKNHLLSLDATKTIIVTIGEDILLKIIMVLEEETTSKEQVHFLQLHLSFDDNFCPFFSVTF